VTILTTSADTPSVRQQEQPAHDAWSRRPRDDSARIADLTRHVRRQDGVDRLL